MQFDFDFESTVLNVEMTISTVRLVFVESGVSHFWFTPDVCTVSGLLILIICTLYIAQTLGCSGQVLKDGLLTSSFYSVGEGPIVQPWPKRMLAPSPRLKELNINEKKYLIDTVSYWFPSLNKQV